MAIPKYNELYRLVLLSLQDGGTHSMKEVRDFIISDSASDRARPCRNIAQQP